MSLPHTYDVSVVWKNDRKGLMTSSVLTDSIEVATPPEFAKGMPGIWSPEHLLVAAVNSCLMTTFLAISENSKLEFESFKSDAVGKLDIVDNKYQITEITLNATVTVANEKDVERAKRILIKSDEACLISNSVKSTIHLNPIVMISEKAN